jgi:hypothetical protein
MRGMRHLSLPNKWCLASQKCGGTIFGFLLSSFYKIDEIHVFSQEIHILKP